MTTMKEMESVVTKKVGNIVAQCKAGKMGLILRKRKSSRGTVWHGRVLEVDQVDCEYRIMQIRNGRLSKQRWQSTSPTPIGFLPPDEVATLLAGGTVSRGC